MPAGRRMNTSTGVRREPDPAALREAIRGPNVDTRHWVSYGIVGGVDQDDGSIKTDGQYVFITPAGVLIDVVLTPSLTACTCRYAGALGSEQATLYAPVKPGDEVLVLSPDGDLGLAPVALLVVNNAAEQMPVGDDGAPLFKNDRVLLHSTTVDLDLRVSGGPRLQLQQGGDMRGEAPGLMHLQGGRQSVLKAPDVRLGDDSAFEPLIKGTTFQTTAVANLAAAFGTWTAALTTYMQAIQSIADPPNVATPPAVAANAALAAALTAFVSATQASLSTVSKTT